MSLHVEWFDANATALTIATAGTTIGEDTVDPGNMALILDGDSCAVMEGSPASIRRKLAHALEQLDALELAVSAP